MKKFIEVAERIVTVFQSPVNLIDFVSDLVLVLTLLPDISVPDSNKKTNHNSVHNTVFDLHQIQKNVLEAWIEKGEKFTIDIAENLLKLTDEQSAEDWYHTVCRCAAAINLNRERLGIYQEGFYEENKKLNCLFELAFTIEEQQKKQAA